MSDPPKFMRFSDHRFKVGEDVYLIDENGYDIFEGRLKSISANKYIVYLPVDQTEYELPSAERLLKRCAQNKKIFYTQEKIRQEKIQQEESDSAAEITLLESDDNKSINTTQTSSKQSRNRANNFEEENKNIEKEISIPVKINISKELAKYVPTSLSVESSKIKGSKDFTLSINVSFTDTEMEMNTTKRVTP